MADADDEMMAEEMIEAQEIQIDHGVRGQDLKAKKETIDLEMTDQEEMIDLVKMVSKKMINHEVIELKKSSQVIKSLMTKLKVKNEVEEALANKSFFNSLVLNQGVVIVLDF